MGWGASPDGVGTFFADDTFAGKPIRVRGRFTPSRPLGAMGAGVLAGRRPDLGDELRDALHAHLTRLDFSHQAVACQKLQGELTCLSRGRQTLTRGLPKSTTGGLMSAKPTLDRRAFVRGAGLLCAGMWVSPALAISEAELFPVATTRYGKIKGITWSGIHAFKGVPYGASTAGKKSWKAPQPPASWRGERECFDYGVISPQVTTDRRSEYSTLIMWDRHVGGMGEDCSRSTCGPRW